MNPTLDGVKLLNETLKLITQVNQTQPGHLGEKNSKAIRDIILGASVGIVSKITELNRDWGINSKGLREFNGRYSTEDYRIPYKDFNWSTVVSNFAPDHLLKKDTLVDKKKAEEFASLLQELQVFSERARNSDYGDRLKTKLPTPQPSLPWVVETKGGESKTYELCLFSIDTLTIKYDGDIGFRGTLTNLKGAVQDFEVGLDNYSTGPSMLPLVETLFPHIQGALSQVIQKNQQDRIDLEKQVQVFVDKYGHHAVLANL